MQPSTPKLAIALLASLALLPAAVGADHPTGHVHDHADQTWPPQPRGLRNAVSLSTPGATERAAEFQRRKVTERERAALARPEVRKLLGRRYNRPDLVESGGKDAAEANTSRLVYFSYENNATVEVTLDRMAVRGVRQIPATEYQPDVTDGEIADAEVLARTYYEARGVQRVSVLQANGLLAYLPEGKGFYPTRVIYMTFRAGDESAPEFCAWVDLTTRRVLRTREERS
jgi:hypothetical protein